MSDPVDQGQVDAHYWFHSIDFGNGVVSKGYKSLNILSAEANAYFDGMDLGGRSVLDIGTWNGFMAFEVERRGASRIVASDHVAWTFDWADRDRPFRRAHAVLGSRVEPVDIDVPDISPERLGRFDIVLFLGVFYHLFDAQGLTRRIAGCAGDLLILETHQDSLDDPKPAMTFYPGAELNSDATNWWGPNPQCVAAILRSCGFSRIFYQDHPLGPTDPAHPHYRMRGLFHAFRDEAAVARLVVRAKDWHDLDDPAVAARIFAPARRSPPVDTAVAPAPKRGFWARR